MYTSLIPRSELLDLGMRLDACRLIVSYLSYIYLRVALSQLLHSAWQHQVAPGEVQCRTQLHAHAENLGVLSRDNLADRTDSHEDGEHEAPVQRTTQTDHKPVCEGKTMSSTKFWVSYLIQGIFMSRTPKGLALYPGSFMEGGNEPGDEATRGCLRLWEPENNKVATKALRVSKNCRYCD